jgi:ATP:ADP antiporter, AAA family
MLKQIASKVFGNFESRAEVQKFILLGLIFGLIIGTYWTLRPIKDGIFDAIVGFKRWQPFAKMLSLILIVPLIIGYGKIADKFSREKLFYIFTIGYGVLWIIFYWFFSNPTLGLANTVQSPYRLLGWAWYIGVESFGTLIVPLFWAFTADVTVEDSAKRGFPLIALMAQIGNIIGPLFLNAKRLGFSSSAPVVLILGLLTFGMALMMMIFMKVTPKDQLVSYQEEMHVKEEKETGFLEGVKLLITKPYLMGIFIFGLAFESIVTIVDFYFKTAGKAAYPMEVDFSAYLAKYAVTTGIVASLCVLFGVSNIQRRLGITASLVMMPIIIALGVLLLKFNPTLGMAFWLMVMFKAVNYALNQPTIKQLYIPTTKDAKYKSQAWIEVFGGRGSKAAGSGINSLAGFLETKYGALAGMSIFLTMSTMASLGMVVVWLFVAIYVAKTYNKAIGEKRVVC